jgi:hypothetical protein
MSDDTKIVDAEVVPKINNTYTVALTSSNKRFIAGHIPLYAQTLGVSYSVDSSNTQVTSIQVRLEQSGQAADTVSLTPGIQGNIDIVGAAQYDVYAKTTSSNGTVTISVWTQ